MSLELTAAERRDLVDVLTDLPASAWSTPTLCEGWRVTEVLAHMTMPFRYRPARFALELAKSGGNFTRMSDRTARRDAAALTPSALLGSLRDNVTHPWQPPGGGATGALSHDVIHGLDITVALGLDRRVPEDRLRAVLSGLSPRHLRYFGVDLAGIELRATDMDWSYGGGTPVTGAAQDLLLLACGRRLPAGHLSGEPSHRFTMA